MKILQSGQHFGASKSKLQLRGTTLTEAGYTPEINVPWHYHENAYFFMHLRGCLEEVNKKRRVLCTTGTLLFHHWQDPHYDTHFSKDARFFHIEIEKQWFRQFQLSPSLMEGSIQLDNPVLKGVFRKVYRELKLQDGASQLSIDGLLLQAFGVLTRQSDTAPGRMPSWAAKIREILHDSDGGKITLTQLALETGIHPVHLSKEFPKYFQAGFGEYIRGIRIEKATGLLMNSTLSVTEIAYRCGFSDQSHFIRNFKEVHGIPPLKYKKSRLKD